MKRLSSNQCSETIINNHTLVAKLPINYKTLFGESKMMHSIQRWIKKNNDRKYLLSLPEYLLRDIGLTRQQVIDGDF